MDESIALVKFSKHSERVWSKPFDYAQIEVGLKIWNPHRCVVGGTPIKKDYRALGCAPGSRAPDILVATPGRLNDHLENSAGFARDTLGGLECLVFDEADHGAGKECEIPNFKGSYLGRFPLVSADFWTSDHLSERPRSVDAFSGTRARGTLTLKRT